MKRTKRLFRVSLPKQPPCSVFRDDEVRVLYVSYQPGPPLNEFVDNFWLIEGGQARRLEKILPCGTSELVVNLKNDEIHIHDPQQPERYRGLSKFFPRQQTIHIYTVNDRSPRQKWSNMEGVN